MFSIPIYPTDPIERVKWCANYEKNIIYYANQIYFEDMFYKHYPYSFVLHTTYRRIEQIMKEMRTYILAVNDYVEKEKYLSCLISADKMTASIRPIVDSVMFHEKTATNIYKKYWFLYRQDPPSPLPNVSSVVLDEEQKDFQIT